jgi:hypothetical protein
MTIHPTILKINHVSDIEFDEDSSNDEDDPTDHKLRYCEDTWLNTNFIYDRPRMPLLGRRGPMRDYGNGMPKFMHSFFFFWPYTMLRKIMGDKSLCHGSGSGMEIL